MKAHKSSARAGELRLEFEGFTEESGEFTQVEVNCPGGFRQRAYIEDLVATIRGVPEETCRVNLKGSRLNL